MIKFDLSPKEFLVPRNTPTKVSSASKETRSPGSRRHSFSESLRVMSPHRRLLESHETEICSESSLSPPKLEITPTCGCKFSEPDGWRDSVGKTIGSIFRTRSLSPIRKRKSLSNIFRGAGSDGVVRG